MNSSTKKTKTMTIAARGKVVVDGEIIELVSVFSYLGLLTTTIGRLEKEVKTHIVAD